MKKRLLSLFLALTLACSLLVFPANAAETKSGICGENVTWTLDENGVLTISGEGEMYAYTRDDDANPWTGEVIQTVIVEPGVTSIGDWAFFDCSWLKTVQISNGVTRIGKSAFYLCSNLEAITIPDSVTSLGSDAFCGCSSLASVTIPESITSLENGLFFQCRKLNSVTIPDSVTSIGSMAFYYCTGLESIVIPEQVTSIGNSAFKGCSSLTDVTIPASVVSIGESAFAKCDSLTDVYYGGTEEQWSNISISRYNTELESVTIHYTAPPPAVIASGQIESLSWVITDDGVLTISGWGIIRNDFVSHWAAWKNVVKSVVMEYGVGAIEANAFYNCRNLERVTIPETLLTIDAFSFAECTGLKEYVVDKMNSNFKSVDGLLFSKNGMQLLRCPEAKSGDYQIPSGVTSIEPYAFLDCSKLNRVTIPSSVAGIGATAFENCSSLTEINIPDSVTSIGHDAFCGCRSLTSISIPDSITSIERGMFSSCSSLKSFTIPDCVTSIGDRAFAYCAGLTKMEIPESVTSIGDYAFYDCDGLTEMTIPASVTSIGAGAFLHCDQLTEICVAEENPNYQSDQGVLLNKAGSQMICCPSGKQGSYAIPEGALLIEDSAFNYCSNLTSVTIPKTVIGIGQAAFEACHSITNLVIPEGVDKIVEWSFGNCSGMKWVSIPADVTMIGEYAFYNCVNLEDVYFGGTESQWNAIVVGNNNEALFNATIHFESSGSGKIETQPSDVIVRPGQIAAFTIGVNGNVVSYQWQVRTPGGEWENCSGNSETLEFIASDEMYGNHYRCIVTDQDGNSVASDPAVLIVTRPVVITGNPSDSAGKIGGIAAFAVEACGDGDLTYCWQYSDDGGNSWYDSGNTSAVAVCRITADIGGRLYRCVVTDQYGTAAASESAKVICTDAIVITTQPEDFTGKENATAHFTLVAEGEGLTYQWQISDNGTKWSNSSVKKAVYATKLTSGRDRRLVRCIVTDQYGNTVTSDSVIMQIARITITARPQDYVGKLNSTAKFTVAAEGEGLTYQWQFSDNGTKWSNSSVKAATYSTKLSTAKNNRMVRCIVSDQYGNSVTTEPATMKIG